MLPYVLVFILLVVLITFFYIKNHLNKGKKNKKPLNSYTSDKKEEKENHQTEVDKISFDVRSHQNVEIDSSTKAIKKIVRRYSNINPLEVLNTEEHGISNKPHPSLEKITISDGSAFDDQEIDFDTLSDNENNPSLHDLKLISEIETDKGNELYKLIDTNLHDKIKNQLVQIAQGDVDDDDDLMDEFKNYKFANSYAENTNDLFNDLENNNIEELELIRKNEVFNTQKDEINTVNKKITLNFTENSEPITDSTLEFNFEFDELEENDN